jgi:hypothetical protein
MQYKFIICVLLKNKGNINFINTTVLNIKLFAKILCI